MNAPPFFLIHGELDAIIPSMRRGSSLRATRRVAQSVHYSEIPQAGDAFDLVDTSHAAGARWRPRRFLNEVRTATSNTAP